MLERETREREREGRNVQTSEGRGRWGVLIDYKGFLWGIESVLE